MRGVAGTQSGVRIGMCIKGACDRSRPPVDATASAAFAGAAAGKMEQTTNRREKGDSRMETIKQNRNALILVLFEIVIGILLLVDADGFSRLIFIAVGAFFIVKAVQGIVAYFRMPAEEAAQGQGFAMALVSLVGGAFLAFQSAWIVELFPAGGKIFGAVILLTGFSKTQWSVDQLRLKNPRWYFPAIAAGFAILAGVLILSGILADEWLGTFSAIALIIGAILDIVAIVMAFVGKKEAAAASAPQPAEAVAGAVVAAEVAPALDEGPALADEEALPGSEEQAAAELPEKESGGFWHWKSPFGSRKANDRPEPAEVESEAAPQEAVVANEPAFAEGSGWSDGVLEEDVAGYAPAADEPTADEPVYRAETTEPEPAWEDYVGEYDEPVSAADPAGDLYESASAADATDAVEVFDGASEAFDAAHDDGPTPDDDLGPVTFNGKPVQL